MKVSEFIALINEKSHGQDLEISFESYEWTDDLEECEYLPRDFDGIQCRKGGLIVQTSR